MEELINYLKLDVSDEFFDSCIDKLKKLIKNGNYILGDEVSKFEENVAKKLGVKYAVGLNSGFSALYLALLSIGLKEGDEVVTVGNSFVATVAAPQLLGAKVVYCEVGPDRNMSLESMKSVVTERTKAIIPVHLAGASANMTEIMEYAKEKGIYVIEDASQAFGAKLNGNYVGSFGDVGCFSMHPTKNLGAFGDAGFIVTDNEDIYKKVMLLRNHGLKDRDHCCMFGFNSRLDELQAAILNLKLEKVDEWSDRRNQIADQYRSGLKGLDLELPTIQENSYCVYFSFVIQVERREELIAYLKERKIECKIHYPIPIHKQEASINAFGEVSLPITEEQNRKILSLPIYPSLTDEQVAYIIQTIKEFYGGK